MIKTILTVKESEELAKAVEEDLKDGKAVKSIGALLENSIKSHGTVHVECDRGSGK